jgi:uncharacterized phage protein (TIGR02218 family)
MAGDVRATQSGLEVLYEDETDARVTQSGLEVLYNDSTDVLVTQCGFEVLYLDSFAGLESSTACFLCRIIRSDGTVLRFTSLDTDLTYAGETYLAEATFQASASESVRNLTYGQVEITALIDSPTIDPSDILNGLYDNADVVIFRVDWSNLTFNTEAVTAGKIASISTSAMAFQAEVATAGAKLNQQVTDTYTPSCRVPLFSTKCTINAASWTQSHTVTAVANRAQFAASGFVEAEGWATAGKMTMTSGANAGAYRYVRLHGPSGTITVWDPFFSNVVVGDTFTITAGCDHRSATCHSKFNNIINYRGFPDIPGDDAVFKYPDSR